MSVKNKKAENTACFFLKPEMNLPDAIQASNPSNFLKEGTCPGDPETLCRVCFDIDEFPLVNGLPDFAGQPTLKALVVNNMNTPLPGSTPYTDPVSGYTITLTFRAEV